MSRSSRANRSMSEYFPKRTYSTMAAITSSNGQGLTIWALQVGSLSWLSGSLQKIKFKDDSSIEVSSSIVRPESSQTTFLLGHNSQISLSKPYYNANDIHIDMSLDSTVPTRTYGISVDLSESLVESLISQGKKPSIIVSAIIQRMSSEVDLDDMIDYAEGRASLPVVPGAHGKPSVQATISSDQTWTYGSFEDCMRGLTSLAEKRASVGDLISMLIAYYDTSARPTSEELRKARGFGPGQKWYEELRTAKTRLTIAARRMGLPSFFTRAYGSGLNRRHPMDKKVYGFLSRWASSYILFTEEYRKLATPRSAD